MPSVPYPAISSSVPVDACTIGHTSLQKYRMESAFGLSRPCIAPTNRNLLRPWKSVGVGDSQIDDQQYARWASHNQLWLLSREGKHIPQHLQLWPNPVLYSA